MDWLRAPTHLLTTFSTFSNYHQLLLTVHAESSFSNVLLLWCDSGCMLNLYPLHAGPALEVEHGVCEYIGIHAFKYLHIHWSIRLHWWEAISGMRSLADSREPSCSLTPHFIMLINVWWWFLFGAHSNNSCHLCRFLQPYKTTNASLQDVLQSVLLADSFPQQALAVLKTNDVSNTFCQLGSTSRVSLPRFL